MRAEARDRNPAEIDIARNAEIDIALGHDLARPAIRGKGLDVHLAGDRDVAGPGEGQIRVGRGGDIADAIAGPVRRGGEEGKLPSRMSPGGSRVTSDRAFAWPAPRFDALAMPKREPIVTASVSALATWTFTSCDATALPAPPSRASARAPYRVHRNAARRRVQRDIGDAASIARTARPVGRDGSGDDSAGERDAGLGDLAFGRGERAIAREIDGDGRERRGGPARESISAPALNDGLCRDRAAAVAAVERRCR